MSDHLIAEANRHAKALDERNDLVVELNLLRQWQREVIQNARGVVKRALLAHHGERKDANARAERAEAELATERAEKDLWKAKCLELIAPHYILDPDLRAQKFRDALAYHPVLSAAMKEGAK